MSRKKGNPAARRARKATDLSELGEAAGLPNGSRAADKEHRRTD
jgi:hypothetical protein